MSAVIARIDDGLYRELKRIQKSMWDTARVEISLPEASRIYHSRKAKNGAGRAEFKFEL